MVAPCENYIYSSEESVNKTVFENYIQIYVNNCGSRILQIFIISKTSTLLKNLPHILISSINPWITFDHYKRGIFDTRFL